MKKNILIFGEPRSGKNTLTNMIFEKFGYQIIRSDCERDVLKEIFPKLNIDSKTAVYNKSFKLYLKELIFQYWRDGRDKFGIVLEGTDTSVKDCNEIFNDENNIIIYLGPINTTPEELAMKIKENDTEFDWSRNLSLEELIEFSRRYINHAKECQKQCQKYGFRFIDTSNNRQQVLEQVIRYLEQELS